MIPRFLKQSLAVRALAITLMVGMSFAVLGIGLRFFRYEAYVLESAQRESTALAESVSLAVEAVRDTEEIERYFYSLSAIPHIADVHLIGGSPRRVIASSNRLMSGKLFSESRIADRVEDVDLAISGKNVFSITEGSDDPTYDVIMPCLFLGKGSSSEQQALQSVVFLEVKNKHLGRFYGGEIVKDGLLLSLLIVVSSMAAYLFVHRRVIIPIGRLKVSFLKTAQRLGFGLESNARAKDELDALVSYHDFVTEKLREHEEELNHALAEARQLARIAERTYNAILVADPGGVVSWANRGFTTLTGYECDEVVGKRPGDLLQGGDTDLEAVRELREAIKNGESIKIDLLNYRKNGDSYWSRVDIETIFDEKGNLEGFIGVQSDITAEKEREAALLEAKEAAEALAQAKTDFLSVISHEIRTPLNGVIGMIELLRFADLDQEQADLIDIAHNCSGALLALINDILDFSKIESGKLELEEVPMDLRKIAPQAYQSTKGCLHEGVVFDWEVDDEVSPSLIGDPTRVTQLLFNLCSNSVKFTKSGHIRMRISLDRREGDTEWVNFVVQDSGVGIAPEKFEAIFEPFTQAEGSTTREFGGTGLGLAICRRICDAMGAQIFLDSRLGEGTTIKILLPFGIHET